LRRVPDLIEQCKVDGVAAIEKDLRARMATVVQVE
jgi:hypothetical protein